MKFKFIKALEEQFFLHNHKEEADKMEKYMQYNFKFIGIKAHLRSQILNYIYPEHREEIENNLFEIVFELYKMEHREYQYIALELLKKNIQLTYKIEYVPYLRKLTELKPWWDTIDIFAKDILGKYLLHFPEMTDTLVNLMVNSNYIWKIRTALLFQVHYKDKTNSKVLFKICKMFYNHKDRFVQNAINWSLNEYSKYEPDKVAEFLETTKLPNNKKEEKNVIIKKGQI